MKKETLENKILFTLELLGTATPTGIYRAIHPGGRASFGSVSQRLVHLMKERKIERVKHGFYKLAGLEGV
jgi:hypothetical protein